ncbi:MAG: hypothetical protein JW917_05530 [Ignavibacteria bacterium]|nr:hypothetical protein [Ignavibacteria bacterium]
MYTRKIILSIVVLIFITVLHGCGEGDESGQNLQTGSTEQYADKEKELQVREEMLNQRIKELDERERNLNLRDSILNSKSVEMNVENLSDSIKLAQEKKKLEEKKKKAEEKEKELNIRLDNPKETITDYIQYIQRGIEGGNFEENMKKASQQWENRSVESFKSSYKGIKKFSAIEDPKVLKQEGKTAKVKVKIKQVRDGKDGKDTEETITVTYNLVADKNGKWKIKSNILDKN